MGQGPPPDKFILDSYAEEVGEIPTRLSPYEWEWAKVRRYRKWLTHVERSWQANGAKYLDPEDVIQLAKLKEEWRNTK